MIASRMLRAVSILWISPVACFAQSAPPSDAPASAWGRVLLTEGDKPIRHARVDFVNSSTGLGESTLTDDNGQFRFEALSPITYQVIVTAPGYQKLESTAQVQGHTGALLFRLHKTEFARPITDDVVYLQELKMSGKAENSFKKGTRLLQKGLAEQSVAYFRRAIAADATYYRAYHNLGLAQLGLGQIQEAERTFQKAIDLTGGGYAPTDFAMGTVLYLDEDYRRAEAVIQKGLEMAPGSAYGKFYLALVQFALNRVVEAEKSAEQALSRNSHFPGAYFLLAAIHQREQNQPAVENDLNKYLHLEPNGPHSDKARSILGQPHREMVETASP
jgi:tetratricopeptide (TPR) repeat protein